MTETQGILTMASALAGHAARRQSVIAANIANADTPGYRSRDLADFALVYRDEGVAAMRATRAGHLDEGGPGPSSRIVPAGGHPSPNGNDVSLETELVRSADARRQHDIALAVMRSSLAMLRSALGRR
ncbi:MAG: FlgB family protein [Pseudomonadota bacterium]